MVGRAQPSPAVATQLVAMNLNCEMGVEGTVMEDSEPSLSTEHGVLNACIGMCVALEVVGLQDWWHHVEVEGFW